MQTELLKETSLYVNDLASAERFYEDVIGLEVAERVGSERSTLRHATTTLILFQATAADDDAEPGQVTFGISADVIAPWRRHLEERGVQIQEVSWPNGMRSIVFCDPAGNRVQLRTQTHPPAETDEVVPTRPATSRGLPAQWKIYHAARLALTGQEAATGSQQ